MSIPSDDHVVAGYSDGGVMLLDTRVGLSLPSASGGVGGTTGSRGFRDRSIVHDWKETNSWVVYALLKQDYTILTGR